jgi:DNA polymerase II small subunit
MQVHEGLRHVVERVISAGWQFGTDAFELIRASSGSLDQDKLADELVAAAKRDPTGRRVIDRNVVEQVLNHMLPQIRSHQVSEAVRAEAPLAAQIQSELKVLRDPSNVPSFGGSMEDFNRHFQDRFVKMREILQRRSDARDASTISNALNAQQNEHVKFIAMIMEKRERGPRLFLTVDDLEDTAQVLVQTERDRQLYAMALTAPLDQVVCIEAVKSSRSLLVAERITLPDIPERRPRGAREEVYAALFSDIHVGSNKFLEEAFKRAIRWLNCDAGNPQQVYVAQRTKYVIIAGDLVDGIGVYPRQEDELAVKDLYEQYKLAARFIQDIPEHMEVIIIPGNHEGVRQALPQPAIPREYGEPLYQARHVTLLGNPCEVELHGVRFLLHHGRSLEDILTSAPGMSFHKPERAMELQLRCRHLAPEYGNRTSIAPIPVDHLIIDNPPDIYHAGHIHVFGSQQYRGTLIVNSGAWQGQTEYQRRMGLEPTPGLLPVVNLQTLKLNVTNFISASD